MILHKTIYRNILSVEPNLVQKLSLQGKRKSKIHAHANASQVPVGLGLRKI